MPKINPSALRDLLSFKVFGRNQTASDCIADVSYNPETEEMTIQFQERGIYIYYGVPLEEYTNLQLAGSMGKYFNNYIRNMSYSYERIG